MGRHASQEDTNTKKVIQHAITIKYNIPIMRLRTMYLDSLAIIIAFARILSASFLNQIPFPAPPPNGDIHLAINPTCGQLSGDTADINAGIDKHSIKTIVSFGASSSFHFYEQPSLNVRTGQLHRRW